MEIRKNMRALARAPIVALLLILVALGTAAAQQTTGDILGTITDNTGAVVSGASITVTNTATSEKRTTNSSDRGDYVVNLLNPGNYTVSITAPGFQKSVVSSMVLYAGDRARVNMQMTDRKSTRLNSSHLVISYAVF